MTNLEESMEHEKAKRTIEKRQIVRTRKYILGVFVETAHIHSGHPSAAMPRRVTQ